MLGVFPPAFWSLALRRHEKVRSVHWRGSEIFSVFSPSLRSRLSSVCFSTCSFDSPVSTSTLWLLPVRCCRCRVGASVASNPGQTDSPGQKDESWCEIKSYFNCFPGLWEARLWAVRDHCCVLVNFRPGNHVCRWGNISPQFKVRRWLNVESSVVSNFQYKHHDKLTRWAL